MSLRVRVRIDQALRNAVKVAIQHYLESSLPKRWTRCRSRASESEVLERILEHLPSRSFSRCFMLAGTRYTRGVS
jgi:hypothetical protein